MSTYADGYHGAEENPSYEMTTAEKDVTPTLAEPHPERFSIGAAENGEYPALCNDESCRPCEASAAAWEAEAIELADREAEAGL